MYMKQGGSGIFIDASKADPPSGASVTLPFSPLKVRLPGPSCNLSYTLLYLLPVCFFPPSTLLPSPLRLDVLVTLPVVYAFC